jgi:hypothetical protein
VVSSAIAIEEIGAMGRGIESAMVKGGSLTYLKKLKKNILDLKSREVGRSVEMKQSFETFIVASS